MLSEAPFKYKSMKVDSPDVMKVRSILDNGYDRQMVSIVGHVDLQNTFAMKFNSNSRKKDIHFNDTTGSIPITLWDGFIDSVTNGGSYTITNIMVRMIPHPILSTCSSTLFNNNSKIVKPAKTLLPLFQKYCGVQSFESSKSVKCIKCNFNATVNPGANIFTCSECGVKSKYSSLPIYFTAKVKVIGNEEEVTIFHYQLKEFAAISGCDMTEDALSDAILNDEKTTIVVNQKNVCVTFL